LDYATPFSPDAIRAGYFFSLQTSRQSPSSRNDCDPRPASSGDRPTTQQPRHRIGPPVKLAEGYARRQALVHGIPFLAQTVDARFLEFRK
jgi:hypothetical protein